MKTCTTCKVPQPLTAFGNNATRPDGIEGRCRSCRAEYRNRNRNRIAAKKAADYLANRDRERVKRKKHREANPEAAAARFARWVEKNPEHFKAYQLEYRRANVTRKAAYEKANAVWRTAYENMRRARKLRATPAWANGQKINEMYAQAAAVRGVGLPCHVDHIVPLKSPFVCGLHNEFNLQLLPPLDNISKGNRAWPDMWN